jgi:hypothetical protein
MINQTVCNAHSTFSNDNWRLIWGWIPANGLRGQGLPRPAASLLPAPVGNDGGARNDSLLETRLSVSH